MDEVLWVVKMGGVVVMVFVDDDDEGVVEVMIVGGLNGSLCLGVLLLLFATKRKA